MQETSYYRLFNDCGVQLHKEVQELLVICDINNYPSFCALQDLSFVKSCISFFDKIEPKKCISPGATATISFVGQYVSGLTKTKFDERYINDEIKQKEVEFPLLTAMNDQIKSCKYSNTIKNFGSLIRIKAGRQVYELLSKNLPMPATSTTDKYLKKFDYILEGELMVSNTVICQICIHIKFL